MACQKLGEQRVVSLRVIMLHTYVAVGRSNLQKVLPGFIKSSWTTCSQLCRSVLGGLPNATALRQSVRKVYPRDINTRSSGFLEATATFCGSLIVRVGQMPQAQKFCVILKIFSLSRGKPGGENLCK